MNGIKGVIFKFFTLLIAYVTSSLVRCDSISFRQTSFRALEIFPKFVHVFSPMISSHFPLPMSMLLWQNSPKQKQNKDSWRPRAQVEYLHLTTPNFETKI